VEAQSEFCDEKFAVVDESVSEEFAGFKVGWRKHPLLRCEIENEAIVEIEVRHRQKAVGFQAMVFLVVPVRLCEPSDLVGRRAMRNELAEWSPSVRVLKALVRAFGVASRRHRYDMVRLLCD